MYIYLAILLFLNSCIHGPADPRVTGLEKLNGKNYETPYDIQVSSIPVNLHPIIQTVRISGKVIQGEEISQVSIPNETVYLVKNQKVIAKTIGDNFGNFYFNVNIPYGDYSLDVNSTKFKGLLPLTIDTLVKSDLNLIIQSQ